ncbi:MAG: Hsp70 family protein [Pirellulales bacterium]
MAGSRGSNDWNSSSGEEHDPETRLASTEAVEAEWEETDFVFHPPEASEDFPVLGDYQILEKIGSGGMGQVFRAQHRTMQRDVALKILPKKLSNHAYFVERFYSEVRAIAKLMHPNIVTAFDAGCAQGVHFLVMELVEGIPLSKFVLQNGPLRLEEAVSFLKQAASALGYAHTRGVVHRDIKPGNMMWTPDGVLKILDFGLARLTQDVKRREPSKQLEGTVEYMSPEQVENSEHIDQRTDFYSLGASLFFLLTGRSMFSGEAVEIALAHLKKQPPALYEVRSDIDLRLDAIFQTLVAKKPEHRFADGEAILEKLESMNLATTSTLPNVANPIRLPSFVAEPATNRSLAESTSQRTYEAIGIELGMMSSRASYLDAQRQLKEIPVDGEKLYVRNMVWSDQDKIAVGDAAAEMRVSQPNQIFYGFQRWYGIPLLERTFAGRKVPPEVLQGVIVRRIVDASRHLLKDVTHAVVNIPSCFDQLHRHCVLTACRCGGVEPLQLLDRPLAAAIALLETQRQISNASHEKQHWLVMSLQAGASEASIVEVEGEVAKLVSTVGDWRSGLTRWHNRIADHLVKLFEQKHAIDVRNDLSAASRLQRTVEMAMNRLNVVQQVELKYEAKQKEISWVLHRDELIRICEPFMAELFQFSKEAIQQSGVDPKSISHVLMIGEHLSLPQVKECIKKSLAPQAIFEPISKADLARGAALQARYLMPPMDASGPHAEQSTIYDIGLVTMDGTKGPGAPKVLIPKGTSLPAHCSKTLRFAGKALPTLQLVESTRLGSSHWHRLGSIHPGRAFPRRGESDPLQLRLEMDIHGILSSKLTWLAGNAQTMIAPLADPPMDATAIQEWRNWIETLMLCQSDD